MMDLKDKSRLVTGASRGIGKAIAARAGQARRHRRRHGDHRGRRRSRSATTFAPAGVRGGGAQLDVRLGRNVDSVVADFEKSTGRFRSSSTTPASRSDNLARCA